MNSKKRKNKKVNAKSLKGSQILQNVQNTNVPPIAKNNETKRKWVNGKIVEVAEDSVIAVHARDRGKPYKRKRNNSRLGKVKNGGGDGWSYCSSYEHISHNSTHDIQHLRQM